MPMVRRAGSRSDFDAARNMFRAYANAFQSIPNFREALRLQGFEAELADLPAKYAPPRGALLLALDGDSIAGCVAFKPLDGAICEMKRLYVRPTMRGCGIGRSLVEAVTQEAHAAGYERMRLDSLSEMETAVALYRSCGFREVPPYNENPSPHAVFLEKVLVASERSAG